MKHSNSDQKSTPNPTMKPAVFLPIPHALNELLENTKLTNIQATAIRSFLNLPFNARTDEVIACINNALGTLDVALSVTETAVQRAKKFDIYDEFFNVGRVTEQSGQTYLHGLLLTYANALKDLSQTDHQMSVIEIPLLRVAVESTLQLFDLGEPA